MRGAREYKPYCSQINGIIPADAGSTRPLKCRSQTVQDHPRGCGEHRVFKVLARLTLGSSPRMRGALCSLLGPIPYPRIIPADAGSTDWVKSRIGKYEDHPRGCGEHTVLPDAKQLKEGSSPRMRGARGQRFCAGCKKRIIPADAGSTRSAPAQGRSSGDHPRGCGEHI